MITKYKTKSTTVTLMMLFILSAVVFKCAWLSDDSFISFRSLKNLVNGFGLTWNTAERVQSFTNPLLLFVIAPFYSITGDIDASAIFVSMLLTLGAAYIGLMPKSKPKLYMLAFCYLLLISSKAFIDYSTSGLENCMSYMISAAFIGVYLNSREPYGVKSFLKLCLVASLMAVNRIDAVLLFIPTLCYALFKNFRLKKILAGLLGFLPFIAWEVFSFLYYGFLFPNTAYAKLNVETALSDRIIYGLRYIAATFTFGDYVTVAVIIAGLIIAFLKKDPKRITLGVGVLLYIFYITYIGGDFMVGRFLSVPFFISVLIIYNFLDITHLVKLFAVVCVVIAAASVPKQGTLSSAFNYSSIYNETEFFDEYMFCDERTYYYEYTGYAFTLYNHFIIDSANPYPNIFPWGLHGLALDENKVYKKGCAGFVGFYAPSKTHIVDPNALCDPLLARLPAMAEQRPGHNMRNLPEGYLQTLETGENVIADPSLAEYYDKLSYIIRGDVFDMDRILCAVNMNLGKYDYLIDEYVENMGEDLYKDIPDYKQVYKNVTEGTN